MRIFAVCITENEFPSNSLELSRLVIYHGYLTRSHEIAFIGI